MLHDSDIAYGLMMASSALGGVTGEQAAAPLAARVARGWLVCLSLLLVGGGYLLVAVTSYALVAYVGRCVTGLGFAVWTVTTTTWRQRLTPDTLRGRADALYRAISWGATPSAACSAGSWPRPAGYGCPSC